MLTNNPIIFFGIITLLAVGIHLYLWARLVRAPARTRRWRRIGAAALVAIALTSTVGFMVTRTVGVDAWWLAWPGYVWIAVMFYLVLALLVLEVPRAVFALWWRRTGRRDAAAPPVPAPAAAAAGAARRGGSVATMRVTEPEPSGAGTPPSPAAPDGPAALTDPGRRLFLARACAATACAAAAGMVGYGMRTAFGDLRTLRVTVPIKGLDPRLSGFRIAVVSDTHFGPFLHRDFAERIVAKVNGAHHDMVAVIGDLADGTVAEVGREAEPLRGLRSRLGTYFVTGNHEYSSGVEEWVDRVRDLGMRPLLNERVEITHQGAAFDLAGVNDVMAPMYDRQGPDLAAALDGRDTSRPTVLMAHQPVVLDSAVEHRVDLQLSGHTHGGQTVPFDRLVGLQQPVISGLARKRDTAIFVTRGAGFFGPPIRAGVQPEVAFVELQSRP